MQIVIFSKNGRLASALLDEIAASGHSARRIDPSDDWVAELSDNPAAAAIFDVAGDGGAARSISAAMREGSLTSKIRQIAIVEEDRLGTEPIPATVDELAVYPFRPGELAARLNLVEASGRASSAAVVIGNVVIDTSAYEVTLNGVPVALTFKEQELLHFLATNPDQVFSRSQLLSEVWGYDFFGGTRTVDVHVRRLRFKLGPQIEARIQTVRNVGYRFSSNI